MGAVTQEAVLLGSTIRETVTGLRTLTDDEVWDALERAAVVDEVRAMPMRLETLVNPATVSGGQQQRILLARALAMSARLLLLDEATSAMDDLSQARVMAALEALDATRIVVAHRLGTVRGADRIVVVDGGKIVEDGTYESLVNANGLFARLVARQLA
jgi:ATP-binding cassette subfamily C protein